MSKHTGKFLAGLTAVGAVAAGAYYYFKKKTGDDFEDEFNEDFDAEEFELDDDLREAGERGYVSLTPGKEAAPAAEKTEAEQTETPAESAGNCSSENEACDCSEGCDCSSKDETCGCSEESACSCCSGESTSSEEGCCCSASASSDEAEEKSEE